MADPFATPSEVSLTNYKRGEFVVEIYGPDFC
jgi:hypothetical protein